MRRRSDGVKLETDGNLYSGHSACYSDSAACLLRDGQIVAAAQEEGFTRKKFDARFPAHAVNTTGYEVIAKTIQKSLKVSRQSQKFQA